MRLFKNFSVREHFYCCSHRVGMLSDLVRGDQWQTSVLDSAVTARVCVIHRCFFRVETAAVRDEIARLMQVCNAQITKDRLAVHKNVTISFFIFELTPYNKCFVIVNTCKSFPTNLPDVGQASSSPQRTQTCVLCSLSRGHWQPPSAQHAHDVSDAL